MKNVIWFSLMLTAFAYAGQAPEGFYKLPDVSHGEVQSRSDKSLLFKYTRTVQKEGARETVKRVFEYPDGRPAATETVIYENDKVIKMTLDQAQTGEKGQFEIRDGKIYFEFTKEGKVSTDSEKMERNFVSQDEIVHHLYNNWMGLMKGDSVNIRLPVIFRTETVGFKFFKESESTETVTIKMKPSSIVIAALVKPLLFTFKKEGDRRLLMVDGRTTPKLLQDGKWKDLDALFVIK